MSRSTTRARGIALIPMGGKGILCQALVIGGYSVRTELVRSSFDGELERAAARRPPLVCGYWGRGRRHFLVSAHRPKQIRATYTMLQKDMEAYASNATLDLRPTSQCLQGDVAGLRACRLGARFQEPAQRRIPCHDSLRAWTGRRPRFNRSSHTFVTSSSWRFHATA